jgi:tryptophan 2,3-dioxygenase
MSAHLTYSSYLHLDELLAAQHLKSSEPEHDEMLFIVIHQVYELWFKQLLHEMDHLKALMLKGDRSHALHTFKRILTILKTVVGQIDILETMTPLEFNSFRGFLEAASGFQSYQFREIEFVMGRKHVNMLNHFADHPVAQERLQARYQQQTLWDAFMHMLSMNGYAIPDEILNRDVTQALEPSPEVQAALIEVYRQNAGLEIVCERLVDLDEGFMEWRYRHVRMVERTIGMKKGTGGSSGAGYLATTISPFFPDLWAIRSQL